jgi:hypothetical protein
MELGRVARAFVWFSMFTACGGHGTALEPRFVAVHNALSAMGMAQSGPISQGSLGSGEDARVELALLAGRCYTFVALGDDSVDDLGLRIVDATNEPVAQDRSTDRQAAVQYCPRRSGDYQLVISMAAGRGGYVASSWEGGQTGAAGSPSTIASVSGTCVEPLSLQVGEVVHGSTAGATSAMTGPCAQGGAPETVYQLVLEQAAQVTIELESAYDGVLYVLRSCGQPSTAVACNDDYQDTSHSRIDTTLQPGTYFVVVDGYADGQGEFDLVVRAQPLRPIGEVCAAAQPLPIGQAVNGSTSGSANYFQATCADGASSPDQLYRLDVTQRSRVRIHQRSQHDGALHLRRTCEDASSEIACNDDSNGVAESLITQVLDPGQYYVVSDGYSGGGRANAGDYVITADVAPVAGGSANADACGTAGQISPGATVEADTFEAADDFSGSCGGAGAPDVVYRLDVRSRSTARVLVNGAQFQGHVYITRGCGAQASEVACGALETGGSPNQSALETVLDPGTYHVVVDGRDAAAFGSANISVQLTDLQALERSCRAAPLLRPGRTVNGTTAGRANQFEASCAASAQSGDLVYRIRLRQRRHVVIEMTSEHDGALHLRRSCIDRTSEVACNDDHEDQRHSRIEADLDAGTYFVVVDGFQASNTGGFSLEYSETPVTP